MRKLMSIFILGVLLISGCAKKESIDLETLSKELPYLSSDEFDFTSVLSSVEYEKENIFDNLIDIYDYDYATLGLSNENIRQAIIRISPTSAQMYMVFDAVQGKEAKLIEEIKSYLVTRMVNAQTDEDRNLLENVLLVQEEEFIACIVSKDNQEILERIKNSTSKYFGTLTLASDNDLELFGLSKEWIESYSIGKPVLTSSKCYVIVKPKKGYEENVSSALNQYVSQLQSYFTISSEQKLIQNTLTCEIEDYQILIISKDNEAVLEAIKTYVK